MSTPHNGKKRVCSEHVALYDWEHDPQSSGTASHWTRNVDGKYSDEIVPIYCIFTEEGGKVVVCKTILKPKTKTQKMHLT
jgi:hypothetical protein